LEDAFVGGECGGGDEIGSVYLAQEVGGQVQQCPEAVGLEVNGAYGDGIGYVYWVIKGGEAPVGCPEVGWFWCCT
jgi:hypothetical protein